MVVRGWGGTGPHYPVLAIDLILIPVQLLCNPFIGSFLFPPCLKMNTSDLLSSQISLDYSFFPIPQLTTTWGGERRQQVQTTPVAYRSNGTLVLFHNHPSLCSDNPVEGERVNAHPSVSYFAPSAITFKMSYTSWWAFSASSRTTHSNAFWTYRSRIYSPFHPIPGARGGIPKFRYRESLLPAFAASDTVDNHIGQFSWEEMVCRNFLLGACLVLTYFRHWLGMWRLQQLRYV